MTASDTVLERGTDVCIVGAASRCLICAARAAGPRLACRGRGGWYAAAYRAADGVQRALGILNSCVTRAIRQREGLTMPGGKRLIGGLKHDLPAKKVLRRAYHRYRQVSWRIKEAISDRRAASRLMRDGAEKGLYAVVRAEQAPNPDSRVTLIVERDALGDRLARRQSPVGP